MKLPKNGAPLNVATDRDSLNPLELEAAIIWLDLDAKSCPYVREILVSCPTRQTAPPGFGDGSEERLVAFSTLAPGAPRFDESGFLRRAFVLRPQDTDAERIKARTHAPSGAVDPQTLRPGCKGDRVILRNSTANNPKS